MIRVITDERCVGYGQPGHPERPERISRTLKRLRKDESRFVWDQPLRVTDEQLRRAHAPELVARLDQPGEAFDMDTPYFPDIAGHARRSVGGALAALQAAQNGEKAISLMRPPGHHATYDKIMGFCYLNNVAVALLEAVAQGVEKVAVYDFDVHHGNGTEAILYDRADAVFLSVHQHPCFPGTGTHSSKNCWNFPVRPQTPRKEFREVFSRAFERLQEAQPQLIAVSAGFDAYREDPLSEETLEAEDYYWLGQVIRELGIPAFSVLEGGYSEDLPELIDAYLKGWEGA